jgi:hypothetical protein
VWAVLMLERIEDLGRPATKPTTGVIEVKDVAWSPPLALLQETIGIWLEKRCENDTIVYVLRNASYKLYLATSWNAVAAQYMQRHTRYYVTNIDATSNATVVNKIPTRHWGSTDLGSTN